MKKFASRAALLAFLLFTATVGRPCTDTQQPPRRAELLFVGDLMAHAPQLTAARYKEGYDFTPSFQYVKALITSADLAVGNFETTLGGKQRGYTGYPCFSTPDRYADALKDAGFGALTTANNHCMDRGITGLFRTLEELHRRGFTTFGTYTASDDRGVPTAVSVQGIKVVFLSWTYGTNGIAVPTSQDWAVAQSASWDEVNDDLTRAKALSPDFIVAMPHIGVEYALTPPRQVIAFTEKLLAAGVNAVIASHPHVVQPVELRVASGDTPALIAWSMGNFISNQRTRPRDMGAILRMTLLKDEEGTRIVGADVIPTWVQTRTKKGARISRVLPLQTALKDAKALKITAADLKRLREAHRDFTERVLGEKIPLEEAQLAYPLKASSQDLFSTAALDAAEKKAAKRRAKLLKNKK